MTEYEIKRLENRVRELWNEKEDLLKEKEELEEIINKLREQLALRYSLEDKIEELGQQIEKMKSCANCKHQCSFLFQDEIDYANNGLPKWELKE